MRHCANIENSAERLAYRAILMSILDPARASGAIPGGNQEERDDWTAMDVRLCDAMLDAVKDSQLHNELSTLAEKNIGKRTSIIILEHLGNKYNCKDFVHRFLHLLDFIDFQQARSQSLPAYVQDFERRQTRLITAYTSAGGFDDDAFRKDLFASLFFQKLGKGYKKKLSTYVSAMNQADFTVENLAQWVQRNVTLADAVEGGPSAHDIAAYATDEWDDVREEYVYVLNETAYELTETGQFRKIVCSICRSEDHKMSNHPGRCPMHRPPPDGHSCPGNGTTKTPHHPYCKFNYDPNKRKGAGRGRGGGGRGGARGGARFARPQESLSAVEEPGYDEPFRGPPYVPAPIDYGYAASARERHAPYHDARARHRSWDPKASQPKTQKTKQNTKNPKLRSYA